MRFILIICLIFYICSWINAQDENVISQDYINKIMSSIEKMRNIKYKSDIEYQIVNRDTMLKLIREEVSRQYNKDEIRYMGIILRLLKLVSDDFDLENFMYKLYQEQAGGLYDSRSKKLYIADWIPTELLDIVLFHELIHALDDQYYDLERFVYLEKSSDAKMARLSVIEGIGTYYMLEYTFERFGMDGKKMNELINFGMLYQMQDLETIPGMEIVSEAPKFIRQQMLFPYFKGAAFIKEFINKKSETIISELYKNPPTSTEQIIHFEKYDSDKPKKTEVRFNKKNLKGWQEVYNDEMGEMGFNLMLSAKLMVDESNLATEGWGGDHIVLLKNNNKYGLILKTEWDTEKDAIEFQKSFIKWFEGKEEKYDKKSILVREDDICLLDRVGTELLIIIGEYSKEDAMNIINSIVRSDKK